MTVRMNVNSKLLLRDRFGRFRERRSLAGGLGAIGGTKLNDINNLSEALNRIEISVGWSGSGIHSKAKVPYSRLASWLELGTQTIPPRPYLERSSQIVSRRIVDDMRNALVSLTLSNTPITRSRIIAAFMPVAEKAKDETQRVILSRAVPVKGNAQSTINRKGSSLPWVDTKELINAMRGRVTIDI